MAGENDQVHRETDQARGGSTPHIVRWMLIISTLAAVIFLSAIWIFGAATRSDSGSQSAITGSSAGAAETGDTDGVLIDQAGEANAAPEPATPPAE